MGMIDITVRGSFDPQRKTFGPAIHGHVATVAEAIEWLSSTVLIEAHNLDHRLHSNGEVPPNGWETGIAK